MKTANHPEKIVLNCFYDSVHPFLQILIQLSASMPPHPGSSTFFQFEFG